jgi:hypothetical protein
MAGTQADVEHEVDEIDLLRADVLSLAQLTLKQLKIDIEYGSMTQRNNAIRMVSPHLLRMLNATGEEDQLGALKQSITDLMSEVRGAPEST